MIKNVFNDEINLTNMFSQFNKTILQLNKYFFNKIQIQ
jgi:hypothetical protein